MNEFLLFLFFHLLLTPSVIWFIDLFTEYESITFQEQRFHFPEQIKKRHTIIQRIQEVEEPPGHTVLTVIFVSSEELYDVCLSVC